MQSRCRRLHSDRHRKILLAPANGTEVGYLPVQASKLEQALRHAHRLAQGQVEQALDRRQAELGSPPYCTSGAGPRVPLEHALLLINSE